MKKKNDFPLKELIDYALATRGEDTIRRDLAKGFDPSQEQYAYKHVCPRVEPRDEQRALRISGLLALTNIDYDPEVSFGRWCGENLDASQVESRLLALQNLPFDQAIKEIRRLISMGGKKGKGFNWYNLANTLYYWGNQNTEGSRRTRLRMLSDYYRAPASSNDESTTPNNSKVESE